jgi:hypothetical protein
MLIMVPLAVDEVIAMGQFMAQSRREGKPFWRTFWKGGSIEGGGPDIRSPDFGAPASAVGPAMVWGVTLPWTLLVSTALGVWLMVAPSALGTEAGIADSDHLVGALVVTFSVIAWAEVTRSLRWLNVAFGIWLLAAPWFLAGGTFMSTVNDLVVGMLLVLISLSRGTIREQYASWNRYIA